MTVIAGGLVTLGKVGRDCQVIDPSLKKINCEENYTLFYCIKDSNSLEDLFKRIKSVQSTQRH